ncbi:MULTISPECIES: hypothetical protein [unclassified Microbacterium]|uniref:hypothetical protein n=1 Tax=unclassified Microbacterium TaxID=2609290 RepID=UPI003C2FB84E
MTTAEPPATGEFADVRIDRMDRLAENVTSLLPGEKLRLRDDLGPGGVLDGALLRQDSDTLIVTFHGLLDRQRFQIPRFERARSTEPFGTSCLYWADPSLWLDPKLKLAWFTGIREIDLFQRLADLSTVIAAQVGASRVIFTGSSGGGFAALQVSALVPGSTALVFNPQTAIYRYLTSTQRRYLANCLPEVLNDSSPESFDFSDDWSAAFDDRYSAVRRYAEPTGTRVFYHSNTLDWHDQEHRQPFESVANASETARVTLFTYEQGGGHQPPSPGRFRDAMQHVLNETAAR